jgi:serine/threonine protein kinase
VQARVTDFGLARRMQSRGDDFTVLAPEATVVMGTFGYVAPEYARTGEACVRP